MIECYSIHTLTSGEVTSLVEMVRLADAGSGSVFPNVDSAWSGAPQTPAARLTTSGAALTIGNSCLRHRGSVPFQTDVPFPTASATNTILELGARGLASRVGMVVRTGLSFTSAHAGPEPASLNAFNASTRQLYLSPLHAAGTPCAAFWYRCRRRRIIHRVAMRNARIMMAEAQMTMATIVTPRGPSNAIKDIVEPLSPVVRLSLLTSTDSSTTWTQHYIASQSIHLSTEKLHRKLKNTVSNKIII